MLLEANELRAKGASFVIDSHWIDKVWLRMPTEATVEVERLPSGEYQVGDGAYRTKQVVSHGESLEKKLHEFGVGSVGVLLWRTKNGQRNVCATKFAYLVDIEAYERKEGSLK